MTNYCTPAVTLNCHFYFSFPRKRCKGRQSATCHWSLQKNCGSLLLFLEKRRELIAAQEELGLPTTEMPTRWKMIDRVLEQEKSISRVLKADKAANAAFTRGNAEAVLPQRQRSFYREESVLCRGVQALGTRHKNAWLLVGFNERRRVLNAGR